MMPKLAVANSPRSISPLFWVRTIVYALLMATPMGALAVDDGIDPAESERLKSEYSGQRDAPSQVATPFYLPDEGARMRALRTGLAPVGAVEDGLNVRALEGFLDFDESDQILYGPGRTQIIYQGMLLEADRLILDNRLQEIQGEGNVIFRRVGGDNAGDVIEADSMRYNFSNEEGVAWGARGTSAPLYFQTRPPGPDDDLTMPPLRQISQDESIFRNTDVSACDFAVPHYYIRAREIILFPQERIFFRGASFYVSGVPVMYLPFYTRSLAGGSPWSFQFGTGDRTGPRIRVGYQFEHEVKEPSFEDEDVMQQRSFGQAKWFADYMAERGFGAGFDYKYQFEFDRHKGHLQAYGLSDSNRNVVGATAADGDQQESERWQLLWQHRSQLTDRLNLQVNIDALSDPDVYYDILDAFAATSDDERNRQVERRGRIALTYVREAYVARLLMEVKDRAGLDRFNNFALSRDNDRDFDLDPFNTLAGSDSDGISQDRWGRVSKKLPEIKFATRYLPIRGTPLYFMKEISIYNNLDKGLNVVSSDDDAWVRGIEFYDQLLWQFKLTERLVLIAKLGVGAGLAVRQESETGIDFTQVTPNAQGNLPVDGALFTPAADGTFIVGDEEFNQNDMDDFYAWADAAVRFNARFTDALTGFVEWKFRETTDNFVGDFYARIGDYTSREDLYAYRLKEHSIEANLNYQLLDPNLNLYANFERNLKSGADLFPNEKIQGWTLGARWRNRAGTLSWDNSVGADTRQVGIASSSTSGEQESFRVRSELVYNPIHGRWYTAIRFQHVDSSGTRIQGTNSDDLTFFTDSDSREEVRLTYGRNLGPKWKTRFDIDWEARSSQNGTDGGTSGIREVAWQLQRDLHDALLILEVDRKLDLQNTENRNDFLAEMDFSLGIEVKLPGEEVAFGPGEISTINQASRSPYAAY